MSLTGLSLRDLEYVVAVADRASFVQAAAHCHVSQPSLSTQIRKLEHWLGAPIFERTSRRVLITESGRRFVDQARRVLSEARLLEQMARAADKPFGGTLRLSAIATLGPYLFPKILAPLKSAYPELGLVLGEGLTDMLLTSLREGSLDGVILSQPLADPAFRWSPLFQESFVLARPLNRKMSRSAEELWTSLPAQERLLLGEGHCLRNQTLTGCSDVGNADRHGTSLETLKYMVSAGEGCTLIPALAATKSSGIRYSDLPKTTFCRDIILAWRRSDTRIGEFESLALALRKISRALPVLVSPRPDS
jgi:LysR family hydrogen peroxide-inducible transcriptional activator